MGCVVNLISRQHAPRLDVQSSVLTCFCRLGPYLTRPLRAQVLLATTHRKQQSLTVPRSIRAFVAAAEEKPAAH